MRRGLFGASVVLLGLIGAPAAVEPAAATDSRSADEAVAAINTACRLSLDALVSGGGSVSGPVEVTVTAGRFTRLLEGRTLVMDEATGTYGSMTDTGLGGRAFAVARRYLDRPRATHWLKRRSFPAASESGWTPLFDGARSEVLGLADDCAVGLARPEDVVSRDGNTWTFGTTSVTLDDTGRLVEWVEPGRVRTFSYGARSVALPGGTVSYRRWTKASEAASLNATLRMTARQTARSVNAGVASAEAIEEALAVAVEVRRVVPLRVRQLRKGSLLYARNPYTNAYYAWRVYLNNGKAVARRVAP